MVILNSGKTFVSESRPSLAYNDVKLISETLLLLTFQQYFIHEQNTS